MSDRTLGAFLVMLAGACVVNLAVYLACGELTSARGGLWDVAAIWSALYLILFHRKVRVARRRSA